MTVDSVGNGLTNQAIAPWATSVLLSAWHLFYSRAIVARITWDEYFFEMAKTAALRGTCPRKKVGAIVVDKFNRALSTGYNGSASGEPHCEDVGCLLEGNRCKRTIHAEENALKQFFSYPLTFQLAPYKMYVTMEPCKGCLAYIKKSQDLTGVVFEVKWLEPYHPEENEDKDTSNTP